MRGGFFIIALAPQIPQPPTFTSTLRRVPSRKLPSLNSATATTSCVLARRMRLVTRRLSRQQREAERGDRGARIRRRQDVDGLDVALCRHRAVDGKRDRHVVAVLDAAGRSSVKPLSRGVAPADKRRERRLEFGARCARLALRWPGRAEPRSAASESRLRPARRKNRSPVEQRYGRCLHPKGASSLPKGTLPVRHCGQRNDRVANDKARRQQGSCP